MAEIQGSGNNTPIINYGVSSREGKIYRSSKTEEAGYQRIEMQNGGVTYHKYLSGLSGKITYVNRDVKEIVGTDGKKKKLDNFKIFLNDGVNTQALSVATYSQEWKLLIKSLYNVDFSKSVVLSYYKNSPEGSDKSYLNSSLKYEGEETAEGKPVYPEWLDVKTVSKGGVVPDPTKNKKGEWDWTDNDIWYQERMEEIINRFMNFKKNNQPSTPSTPAPKTEKPMGVETKLPTMSANEAFAPATNVNSNEYDALPF
jgi:hypothetical protein